MRRSIYPPVSRVGIKPELHPAPAAYLLPPNPIGLVQPLLKLVQDNPEQIRDGTPVLTLESLQVSDRHRILLQYPAGPRLLHTVHGTARLWAREGNWLNWCATGFDGWLH